MSLPKQTVPPLSSSSSKQSLRGNTGSQARPGTVERHEYSTAPEASHGQHAAEDVFSPQDEDRQHSLTSSPQLQLKPFFTLIEDANASEYYHPTLHYIFSDDDTDIVTEAALRSLEVDHGVTPAAGATRSSKWRHAAHQHEHGETYDEDEELDESPQASPRKTSSLPPPIPGVQEHYIILDMEPTNPNEEHVQSPEPTTAAAGTASMSTSPAAQQQQTPSPQPQPAPNPLQSQFTITSAHSLTPAWQVLNTQLTPAPTFDSTTTPGEQQQPGSSGLMLKIEGTSGLPRDPIVRDRDRDGKDGGQTLEEMMEQFEKRMGELRRVIEAGGGLPAGGGQGGDDVEAGTEVKADHEGGVAETDPTQQGGPEKLKERNQLEHGTEEA